MIDITINYYPQEAKGEDGGRGLGAFLRESQSQYARVYRTARGWVHFEDRTVSGRLSSLGTSELTPVTFDKRSTVGAVKAFLRICGQSGISFSRLHCIMDMPAQQERKAAGELLEAVATASGMDLRKLSEATGELVFSAEKTGECH